MNDLVKSDDYRQWIVSVKERVQASQIKAAVAVNYCLLYTSPSPRDRG